MDLLNHVQQIPAATVGHRSQRLAGLIGQRERPADKFFGASDEGVERRIIEAFQNEDLAAGQ